MALLGLKSRQVGQALPLTEIDPGLITETDPPAA
jgi:hypothetical protein